MTGEPIERPGGYAHAINGNRWHSLLYILMRDGHISPGALHSIVADLGEADLFSFSNDFLAAYAIQLNSLVGGESPEVALSRGHFAIRRAQGQEP